ncbi:NUDIX hydrolase [Paenibacillus sambharensis]|uniref:NUDIX hydrolase n=1 Tax=Paenibacillus sambharensis TaxID=1803190 RepID=A0A2W1LXP0_9BACL|nr:NUDIX domain-containing protein [Paenibacillus sambharensis]PZD96277.1 NUDIX hydrolase [Paenibacillus sambharensis]
MNKVDMMQRLANYPVLSRPMDQGYIEARFVPVEGIEAVDESLVSNVSIIPVVGGQYAVMQLSDGRWELAGGTLEPGEHYMNALRREVMEELGAELVSFRLMAQIINHSSAPKPYRPHIPHPVCIRLIGYGEIQVVCSPLNPPDGEQVAAVETVSIDEAVRRFRSIGREDIAEYYLYAHQLRTAGQA